MISAITVTYGRTKLLQVALHNLLNQDFPGEWEHLIVNTFHKQKFSFEHPKIRIINLESRPETLGHARNIAVESAAGERIVIADDDDVYLPNFLRTFNENWSVGDEWVWLDKRLCANGNTIVEIGQGCHGGCFGFTKKAWGTVGGYPAMSVGEDRQLVQKITKLPGKRVRIGDGVPPFICCWGNGAHHISGGGDDRPGVPGAYVRAEAALNRRLSNGEEKTGKIVLQPKCDVDWPAIANAFMAAELKKNSMSDVCVVLLGRYGDITNALPILKHIHDEYATPNLMVSEEFADILDGVSYVTPYKVKLRNDQLEVALKMARKEYKHVVCAQVWGGPNYFVAKQCPSYNIESWFSAGFINKFNDESWIPLFDRRDKERERLLVQKVSTDKPMLLVNVTHSVSSPFPDGSLLLNYLQDSLGKEFNIVNVGGLKLHRIYDLLGLMDAAACLVSVDSAHLHLAAGSTVPTIALVNNEPWQASVMRHNCAARYRYDYAKAHPEDIVTSIRFAAKKAIRQPLPTVSLNGSCHGRKLIHCVERHAEKNHREANRKGIAQRSWAPLYEHSGVVPCYLEEHDYPRTAKDIGETRELPFLKDVLMNGLNLSESDKDIIFFTNDDNILHPQLPEMLRFHVSLYDCCCAQRCEFKGCPMPPMNRSPNEFANAGLRHMGRDLFAFTVKWLEEHWEQIPDFILGCSDWDLCMACMVRNHFQIKSTRRNLETIIFPAELPLGYVSHSYHEPKWNTAGYVNSAPGQMHNRKAFQAWAKKYAPHLNFDANLCI